MKDKVFFQLVAMISLVVTIAFLFMKEDKTPEIAISGGTFVVATFLSLLTGRSSQRSGND